MTAKLPDNSFPVLPIVSVLFSFTMSPLATCCFLYGKILFLPLMAAFQTHCSKALCNDYEAKTTPMFISPPPTLLFKDRKSPSGPPLLVSSILWTTLVELLPRTISKHWHPENHKSHVKNSDEHKVCE